MKTLSEVKPFLKKTDKLLNEGKNGKAQKISSDMIASEISKCIHSLFKSVRTAEDTQKQVNALAVNVKTLEADIVKIMTTLQLMKDSFNRLDRRLTLDAESERLQRKKLNNVLEKLEQYLRIHT